MSAPFFYWNILVYINLRFNDLREYSGDFEKLLIGFYCDHEPFGIAPANYKKGEYYIKVKTGID